MNDPAHDHDQPSFTPISSAHLIQAVENMLRDLLVTQPDARFLSLDGRLVQQWIHLLAVARGAYLPLGSSRVAVLAWVLVACSGAAMGLLTGIVGCLLWHR